MNPQSKYENDPSQIADYPPQMQNFEEEQPCDDEEEMMEMMAMQEECRLEMMKFYVQSQNPKLFEEIYHDVSYPDNKMKELKTAQTAAATDNANPQTSSSSTSSQVVQQQQHAQDEKALKDLIINKLNPSAFEFIPNKFSTST